MTAFPQQLEHIRENGEVPFSILKYFERDDINDNTIEAASKIKLRASIRPGRNWQLPNVKVFLEKLTKDVMEDAENSEGFSIVTKNGDKLTQRKMTISRQVQVNGNAQTLNVDHVFRQLKAKFEEMRRAAN